MKIKYESSFFGDTCTRRVPIFILDGRPINFAFPFTKLQYKLLINLSQIYNCAVKNSNSLNIVTATDLTV